jgi:hypothetical protein
MIWLLKNYLGGNHMQDVIKNYRHDKEYWQEQISKWRASGMTQKGYCTAHGINRWSFLNWRKKLTKDVETKKFIEVKAEFGNERDMRTIEITFNGLVIRSREDINPHVLCGMLSALGWGHVR